MPNEDRPGGDDRRAQIINSALDLMYDHGIAGATTARIAGKVGVSEPALYRHFRNKQEILLATIDEVGARLVVYAMAAIDSEADPAERLRLMSGAFYDFTMSHPEETRVLFEAVGAARDADMKEALRRKFAELLKVVEGMVAEGVASGALRADADIQLTAWEIVSLGVTLYFASTLGLMDVLTREKALAAVDRLLASLAEDRAAERRLQR